MTQRELVGGTTIDGKPEGTPCLAHHTLPGTTGHGACRMFVLSSIMEYTWPYLQVECNEDDKLIYKRPQCQEELMFLAGFWHDFVLVAIEYNY